MARLALEIQKNAPQDPSVPTGRDIPSSYITALNTVSTCIILADIYDVPHLIADITLPRYSFRRHFWDMRSR
jgi:hypothetical protein